MSKPRYYLVTFVALICLFMPALPLHALPAPKIEPKPAPDISVNIIRMTPILSANAGQEDAFLDLRVTLSNNTQRSMNGRISVSMQTRTPVLRSALEKWMNPASAPSSARQVTTQDFTSLSPETSVNIDLSIPASQLPLGSRDSWGPRGIAVDALDEFGVVLDSARSFMLWDSGVDFSPSKMMFFIPVTPTAQELLDASTLETSLNVKPSTRLLDLTRLGSNPLVTLAINPTLISDSQNRVQALTQLTSTEVSTLSPPPEDGPATPWFPALDSLAHPLELLPLGDVDLQRLSSERAHARLAPSLLDDWGTLTQGHTVNTQLTNLGIANKKRLIWPVPKDNQVNPDSLNLGLKALKQADSASKAVALLPAELLPPKKQLTYTPSSTAAINTASEQVSAVLTDASLDLSLSQSLTTSDAVGATRGTAESVITHDATSVAGRQWFLAQSAVLTRELPAISRVYVASLPRDAKLLPEAEMTLNQLAQARWLQAISLDQALEEPVPDVKRDETLKTPEEDTSSRAPYPSLSDEFWSQPIALHDEIQTFSSILEDPQALSLPARFLITQFGAVAWRDAIPQHLDSIEKFKEHSQAITKAVVAQPSSTINVIDSSAKMPVGVSNNLSVPINILVNLETEDLRLQPKESPALTIPAHSAKTAQVAIKAVGSGDVRVDVQVLSPLGQTVSTPSSISVRVRADWETSGTAVLGGAVLLFLIVGLIRNIRRGRRSS
ncbi:MAG: DUF6049 family protein [Actinomycetaceae bacterium]|nr:DUF6049 family protein [Actinomycetaceae bacterium]